MSEKNEKYPSIFGKSNREKLIGKELEEFNNLINSSNIYKEMYNSGVFIPDNGTLSILREFADKASNESVDASLVSVRAEFLRNELFGKVDKDLRCKSVEFTTVSEILTGLSGGITSFQEKFELKDILTIGHSDDYIKRNQGAAYSEFLTEYMKVKLLGKTDAIDKIRYFCGDELVNTLENEYQNIINGLRKLDTNPN